MYVMIMIWKHNWTAVLLFKSKWPHSLNVLYIIICIYTHIYIYISSSFRWALVCSIFTGTLCRHIYFVKTYNLIICYLNFKHIIQLWSPVNKMITLYIINWKDGHHNLVSWHHMCKSTCPNLTDGDSLLTSNILKCGSRWHNRHPGVTFPQICFGCHDNQCWEEWKLV